MNIKALYLPASQEKKTHYMSREITKYPPGPTYKMPGKLIRQFIHDPIKTLSTISQKIRRYILFQIRT